jgi:aspartyl-tRNA(Asn)/glutamyl-tRNA(Gln) amidotransferase subunit A
MAVAGLGTDGGGSIRRPAGYTGLWGLKPGIGTVTRGGGLPQVLLDFETVGPITRSARDLTLFQSVLAPLPEVPEGPLTILAVSHIKDAPCDPGILACFASTIEKLRALGHTVIENPLPLDLDPLGEVWSGMAEIGLAHLAAKDPAVMASAAEKYKAMAARGGSKTAVDLYEALTRVFALREAVRGLWGHDAVLMPTAAAPPWAASEAFPETIAGQPVGPRGHAVYTGWVNAAGLPAMAFPAGPEGALPIGMQLVGDHGSEAKLLSVARALDG